MFLPGLRVAATVLIDGFVAGTWSSERAKQHASLVVHPFEALRSALGGTSSKRASGCCGSSRPTQHVRSAVVELSRLRDGRAIVAALVLTGVGAAYAWPLLGSLTTAIPGGPTDHDVATMVWNVGYVFRALTSDAGLLTTTDVLVPFGADLRLHTYGLLQGLAAAPLVPLLGVPGAFNVMLVGTLVLNGIAGYALMRKQRASHAGALVAATCLMLALPLLDQLRVGRPTFASVWIVACALIVAGSLVDAPRLWKGLLLGLVLVAALLTDFQIVFFCGVWLAIYGIAHFRTRHVAALAVGALVFFVPFACCSIRRSLAQRAPAIRSRPRRHARVFIQDLGLRRSGGRSARVRLRARRGGGRWSRRALALPRDSGCGSAGRWCVWCWRSARTCNPPRYRCPSHS